MRRVDTKDNTMARVQHILKKKRKVFSGLNSTPISLRLRKYQEMEEREKDGRGREEGKKEGGERGRKKGSLEGREADGISIVLREEMKEGGEE